MWKCIGVNFLVVKDPSGGEREKERILCMAVHI